MHPYYYVQYVPVTLKPDPAAMKVNWTTSPNLAPKVDTSKHYHVFVGDLCPSINADQLRDAFTVFGDISECKVILDQNTQRSKGYGFVTFVNKADAEAAINNMKGQCLGSRNLRTNWASRKQHPAPSKEGSKPLSYDEVFNQSSPTNCTVYCGGVMNGLTDELMRNTFKQFGEIQEVRVFKDKGYAFIRFCTKDAATNAICTIHGSTISDQPVRCSWGREPSAQGQAQTAGIQAASTQPQPESFGPSYYNNVHPMYWNGGAYPNTYSPPVGAIAAPAVQQQYLQPNPMPQWPNFQAGYQAYGSVPNMQLGQPVQAMNQQGLVTYSMQQGYQAQ